MFELWVVISSWYILMKPMAIVTGGQIAKYYESYSEIEVSFNKQVIDYTGLDTYAVFMRVAGMPIPCVIYSFFNDRLQGSV